MYYINTLKSEVVDTNAYKLQPSLSERVIVDEHSCHTALNFDGKAKENQDRVPTLYWLPKLHKRDFLMSLSDDKQADVVNAFNSTSRYLDETFKHS